MTGDGGDCEREVGLLAEPLLGLKLIKKKLYEGTYDLTAVFLQPITFFCYIYMILTYLGVIQSIAND